MVYCPEMFRMALSGLPLLITAILFVVLFISVQLTPPTPTTQTPTNACIAVVVIAGFTRFVLTLFGAVFSFAKVPVCAWGGTMAAASGRPAGWSARTSRGIVFQILLLGCALGNFRTNFGVHTR